MSYSNATPLAIVKDNLAQANEVFIPSIVIGELSFDITLTAHS
jgi:hypothetical protein